MTTEFKMVTLSSKKSYVSYTDMIGLHYFAIFMISFVVSMTMASQTYLVNDLTILKENLVVKGDTLRVLETYSPVLCMRECLSFSVCKSVNIYLDSLRCELMLHNSADASGGVVTSSEGMTIDAEDIPEEYAGVCRDNICLPGEKCVGKQQGGHACVAYDFCTTSPAPFGVYDKFTIDKSKGIPRALYSCPPGTGYYQGERYAYCDPHTNTWSTPSITCESSIPNGCGIPPPLPNTEDVVRSYGGNHFKAIYTCPSLSGQDPVDHCPLTNCIGVETWTDANISCSEKDCYTGDEYEGHVTCTKTGKTCQRWDKQAPHLHLFFIFRSDFHNHCKITPDVGVPWCFTTDPFVRWEECPVPEC